MERNKVSVINVDGKSSPKNTIETNLAAYEEKQKAISDRRKEYSIGMVTNSYERLSLSSQVTLRSGGFLLIRGKRVFQIRRIPPNQGEFSFFAH